VLADDTEELLNLIRGFRISDRGAPTETGRQPQWRKAG
jgi:methyl-accepting chemotaxis protein